MMLEKVLKRFWDDKVTIFFIALVGCHFLFIGSLPAGFNHDEIEKIASISSFISNGTDISGISFPKALISTRTQGGQNNFPILLLTSIFRFIQLNQFTTRIPMVILNIATAFLLSRFVRIFFPKGSLFKYVFFISLINPWMWFLSRNITEAPFSLFFVLGGIFLLERNSSKHLLLGAISFIAALLSYWGTLVIVPIIFVSTLFIRTFQEKSGSYKKLLLPILIFVSALVVLGISLFFVKDSTLNTRSSELIVHNVNRYQPEVDKIRGQSITNILAPLFVNKYVLLFNDFTTRYANSFSISFLFLKGDPRATYQFGSHGMFYLLDFPLIILGIMYLATQSKRKKTQRLLLYLIVIVLTAPLGSALNIVENSYVFRSIFILPVFLTVSGSGLYALFVYSRKIGLLVVLAYLLLFVNFLHFYLYQYSVSHQENQFWSEEVVSSYLKRIPEKSAVTVVTGYPIQVSEKYLFYKKVNFTKEVVDTMYSPHIQFNIITFTSTCPTVWSGTVIVQDIMRCPTEKKAIPLIIENYSDSGSLWKIYNDTVCSGTPLAAYRGDHQLIDYRLYNQDTDNFCRRQIHKYE